MQSECSQHIHQTCLWPPNIQLHVIAELRPQCVLSGMCECQSHAQVPQRILSLTKYRVEAMLRCAKRSCEVAYIARVYDKVVWETQSAIGWVMHSLYQMAIAQLMLTGMQAGERHGPLCLEGRCRLMNIMISRSHALHLVSLMSESLFGTTVVNTYLRVAGNGHQADRYRQRRLQSWVHLPARPLRYLAVHSIARGPSMY